MDFAEGADFITSVQFEGRYPAAIDNYETFKSHPLRSEVDEVKLKIEDDNYVTADLERFAETGEVCLVTQFDNNPSRAQVLGRTANRAQTQLLFAPRAASAPRVKVQDVLDYFQGLNRALDAGQPFDVHSRLTRIEPMTTASEYYGWLYQATDRATPKTVRLANDLHQLKMPRVGWDVLADTNNRLIWAQTSQGGKNAVVDFIFENADIDAAARALRNATMWSGVPGGLDWSMTRTAGNGQSFEFRHDEHTRSAFEFPGNELRDVGPIFSLNEGRLARFSYEPISGELIASLSSRNTVTRRGWSNADAYRVAIVTERWVDNINSLGIKASDGDLGVERLLASATAAQIEQSIEIKRRDNEIGF